MNISTYKKIIASDLPTPCYILDEAGLIKNCKILKEIQDSTNCKILLAQKAFSNYDLYPVISQYLAGTEASGLYEARLGFEEMSGKECHVFCAAYKEQEFEELLQYADHIVFNSPSQFKKYGFRAKNAGKQVGIRVNPEFSTQNGHEIYDPCAKGSRLGTTIEQWKELMTDELTDIIDGIHFHTLCEQNSDALESTLEVIEEKFGFILNKIKWLNIGGGHHITRDDYDIKRLKKIIIDIKKKYNIVIYIEPGEAVALNSGYLYTKVLDVVKNGDINIAITDMSAACHTPDVIEMPYRPPLYSSGIAGEKTFTYRLGGPTCLAGDIIGDYSFDYQLNDGSSLIFEDMAIYSTCKNNTFNGMPLPDIWVLRQNGDFELLARFGYEDFKFRLGSKS